jgi:hypothetical protein
MHLVGAECIAKRAISPVHQQRPLGVDHPASAAECLNASGMRFDVDDISGQFQIDTGRKPPGGLVAERPAPGDQTHKASRSVVLILVVSV